MAVSHTGGRRIAGDEVAGSETLLRIDEGRAVAALSDHLRSLCVEHSADEVLVGLSGGLDSSVLVALAARALGPESVHAMYLFDPDSDRGQGRHAEEVAVRLGIGFVAESIEGAWEEEAGGRGRSLWFTRRSPRLNRLLFRVFRQAAGETAFVSSLRAGGNGSRGRATTRFVAGLVDELFYGRHRYRRVVLEAVARDRHWLLLGAANRTEWEVGWFVHGGVDDLPHQPLLGLYKTQVRQIGRYLGVPAAVLQQTPSPDMLRGVGDEFAIGMSYDMLDLGLDCLSGGLSQPTVRMAGVTDETLRRIAELKELSRWKRPVEPVPFPVDGGPEGGLRVDSDR
jgi:NAD+ synthase